MEGENQSVHKIWAFPQTVWPRRAYSHLESDLSDITDNMSAADLAVALGVIDASSVKAVRQKLAKEKPKVIMQKTSVNGKTVYKRKEQ